LVESDEVGPDLFLDRHRPQYRGRQISAEQEHPAIVRRSGASKFADITQFAGDDLGRAGSGSATSAALCASCAAKNPNANSLCISQNVIRPRLSAGLKDVLGEKYDSVSPAHLRDPGSDHRLQIVKLKASGAESS